MLSYKQRAVFTLGSAKDSFQDRASLFTYASVCSNQLLPQLFAFLIPLWSHVAKSLSYITGENV